jgi:hypothetical protein
MPVSPSYRPASVFMVSTAKPAVCKGRRGRFGGPPCHNWRRVLPCENYAPGPSLSRAAKNFSASSVEYEP